MDKLRVDSGIKQIEVNDDGEYISFSVTDSAFFENFFNLINWFDSEEVQKSIAELDKQKESIDGTDNMKKIQDVIVKQKELISQVMDKIDAIFGEEASRKIFCGKTPDFYAIADFFEQIAPYIEKYAKERNRNISKKYSTKRKGAKS